MSTLNSLFGQLGYVVLVAIIITKINSFKKVVNKNRYELIDKILLSLVFIGFGILSSNIGIKYDGALFNISIVAIIVGGIFGGNLVGISTAIVTTIYEFISFSAGDYAIWYLIFVILIGFVSGSMGKDIYRKKSILTIGFLGFVVEFFQCIFIALWNYIDFFDVDFIIDLCLPMAFGTFIALIFFIFVIYSIFRENNKISEKDLNIALNIANKTLSYLRRIDANAIEKVCEIIKEELNADAISIIYKDEIITHVGLCSEYHIVENSNIIKHIKRVKGEEILVLNTSKDIGCDYKDCQLRSVIIVPLREKDNVIGFLKVYFSEEYAIDIKRRNQVDALGQLLSMQLELAEVEELKEKVNKSEIKALQAQINPHFLFNALSTISSFIRIDPSKARELIINLSRFLRYNLEVEDMPVDIYSEIEQVKAYIEIELARFGDRLSINYDIDEDLKVKIPSLIIQPLVENAIKHGIFEGIGKGTINININKVTDYKVLICVEDDGIGISKEVIRDIKNGTTNKNKIGLANVHNRLKLIYGTGLYIERLNKGTRVSFIVE